MIDYRSDTVTHPTASMLEAMMKARVGDDVFGEDPTVNALESKAAAMFGMEAGLFCPSGTMTNQIAIKAHTQPGDEVICDQLSHVYQYEGGGIAFNSGASVRLLQGHRGLLDASQIAEAINPDDVHKANSSLVVLENTCNRGGGSCYQIADIELIKNICATHKLALHLDGARLFNALVAKNETAVQYGAVFDSISICLSKGLGTPVGSLLLGKSDFIRKARRIRKVFGGGMRQAGYLAAAGIYALDHHIARLEEDHVHAKMLEQAWLRKSFVKSVMPVETNIVIAETEIPAAAVVEKLEAAGVAALAMGTRLIRMVTHLDISPAMVDKTLESIEVL